MNNHFKLSMLVLAAPFLLSACGSGSGSDPVQPQLHHESASHAFAAQTVVFAGARADYTITKSGNGYQVSSKAAASLPPVLVGANARLRFADTSLALDIDLVAGQAYRVYQAAFGRTPDIAGLSFWMSAMDNGASAEAVAAEFVKSDEFKAVYGVSPTNAAIVDRLYVNVLHRAGEPAGIDYWMGVLDKNLATRAQVLAAFAESAENKAGVLPTIAAGISYQEIGVKYSSATAGSGLSYTSETMATSSANAFTAYNDFGAKGFALVGPMTSFSGGWSIDLFAKSPGSAFSYEVVDVSNMLANERLANFAAMGAKGFLYKSEAAFGANFVRPYDIFVKSSTHPTTYSYRLVAEAFAPDKLNQNGAQGYAYRGQLVLGTTTYSLYVKDNGSDAIFNYVLGEDMSFSKGLLSDMNRMGAQGFGFLGETVYGGTPYTLFVRSSASSAPFSYSIAPAPSSSPQTVIDTFNAKAANGEAYWGDMMDGSAVVSLYYKGGWLVHPLTGPTFP